MARYPFPTTPTGWYQLAYGDELAPGAVIPVRAFGRELVAWRDEAGAAHVLDAFCPHLGAHLGHGGRVDDGALRCPFHGWRIGGDGACLSIPGGWKVPPRARARSWPVHEVNGLLLVHHDADGVAPSWRVPSWDELAGDGFHPPVRRCWTIRTHVQEVVENAFDAAHFPEVHQMASLPQSRVAPDGAILRGVTTMQQRTPRGVHDTVLTTTAYGLGVMTLRFTGIVDTLIVSGATPIDDEHIALRFSMSVTRDGGALPDRGVGAAILADIANQVDQDVPIWEHKAYRLDAALSGADAALSQMRRWARQFTGAPA